MDKVYIISGLLSFLSFPLIAQNSDYQAQYREKVLEYNQDLKAAGYNEAMKQEMINVASLMAQKVVASSITAEIQSTLVDETLKEMGESTWQN